MTRSTLTPSITPPTAAYPRVRRGRVSRGAAALVAAAGIALVACPGDRRPPAPPPRPGAAAADVGPPGPRPDGPAAAADAGREPAADAAASSSALSRAEAVRRAEAFVLAQGYTDAVVPPPSALRREMTDQGDDAEILAARRWSLEARSAGALGEGEGWIVVFRPRSPARPGIGRAVRVAPGEGAPEMVHQDFRLDALGP